MNIHEYQAKELLAKFGVAIPKGIAAMSVEEAVAAAKQAGFDGIELCIAESGVLTPSTDEATCRAYAAEAAAQGLALETVSRGFTRLQEDGVIDVTGRQVVIRDLADYSIEIPDAEECFVPLLAVIPLQLLAYYIATIKGCNVDQPRNLAKSVTVE